MRDIVRKISNGVIVDRETNFKGVNVTVVDERGEIGACYKGVAQNDLGIRTDILADMPKSIGMKMAIRSMAPKVIVADEIGSKLDAEAIEYATCCGVKGIFTAHGNNLKDLMINSAIKSLIREKIFERIIVIKSRNGNKMDTDIYELDEMYSKYEIIKKGQDI